MIQNVASLTFAVALVIGAPLRIAPAAGAVDPVAHIASLIRADRSYSLVPRETFEALGWDLPDGGRGVRALADATEGGAFDPKRLESLAGKSVGYKASWHVLRYRHYGLDWDVTGLKLTPMIAEPGLPTVAFIHGGSANWYEFFVDPLNGPGLAQYLAQRVPVLLITIPGNYRAGGWTAANDKRAPAYLLDSDLPPDEIRVRNAVFTFTLVAEGVARLVESVTQGPLLIAGHSTGGELQFLLKKRLASRLKDRSLGWGTGGPATLRRTWEEQAAPERDATQSRRYPPVTEVRGRGVSEYTRGYVGPLNPLAGGSVLEVAERWFAREGRRRPHFKQPLQDIEHTGQREAGAEAEIRAALAGSALEQHAGQVIADLFSTLRVETTGYRRMLWTTAALDDGHWDEDPAKARELFVANQFRKKNPEAQIRVLVYDLPMTHYGHIERPKQLAAATLAGVRWLVE